MYIILSKELFQGEEADMNFKSTGDDFRVKGQLRVVSTGYRFQMKKTYTILFERHFDSFLSNFNVANFLSISGSLIQK